MSEEQKETKGLEIAGLWLSPKGHCSGQVKETVTLEAGEYLNLFLDTNPNPNSPKHNLVVFREVQEESTDSSPSQLEES